jgi:DNA-binding winged helix-turn-helix (wHTH) protein
VAAASPAGYRFGSFTVDSQQRVLLRAGELVPVPPKVFDVLFVLVEHAGRVVLKKDLLDQVWPGTYVEEANLSVNISALRRVLGDGVIETIPKRGYRFVMPVEVVTAVEETQPGSSGLDTPPPLKRLPASPRPGALRRWSLLGLMLVVVAAVIGLRARSAPLTVVVLPFANPSRNEIAGSLVEAVSRTVAVRLADMRNRGCRSNPVPEADCRTPGRPMTRRCGDGGWVAMRS